MNRREHSDHQDAIFVAHANSTLCAGPALAPQPPQAACDRARSVSFVRARRRVKDLSELLATNVARASPLLHPVLDRNGTATPAAKVHTSEFRQGSVSVPPLTHSRRHELTSGRSIEENLLIRDRGGHFRLENAGTDPVDCVAASYYQHVLEPLKAPPSSKMGVLRRENCTPILQRDSAPGALKCPCAQPQRDYFSPVCADFADGGGKKHAER